MGSRADIINEARREIGQTNPDPYWAESGWPEYPAAWRAQWCGAFAMAMLKRARVLPADAKWKMGIGFISPFKLQLTKNPEPGDIAYKDQPFQHHMIVESYDPKTDTLYIIAGNELNPKGGATIVKRALRNTKDITFYSVKHLVTGDSGIGSGVLIGALALFAAGLAVVAFSKLKRT